MQGASKQGKTFDRKEAPAMRERNQWKRIHLLSPAIEPKRDLWTEIEKAIQAPGKEPRPSPSLNRILVVAAAIAIIIGGITVSSITLAQRQKTQMGDSAHLSYLLTEVTEAYAAYENSRDQLLQSLEDFDKRYGYGLSGKLTGSFKAIDLRIRDAIALINARPEEIHTAGSVLSIINSQLAAFTFTEAMMRETDTEE